MQHWRLELFGNPCLVPSFENGPATQPLLLHRQDAAWLALVALGGGLRTEQVAVMTWPRSGRSGSLNNLRQRVLRLRRRSAGARLVELNQVPALAPDLVLRWPDDSMLEADPDGWNAGLLGDDAYDDAEQFSEWLSAQRRSFSYQRRAALARMATRLEAENEIDRAVRYARRLVADEPLSEPAHQRLMRLHFRQGDRAAALAAHTACAAMLRGELGIDPSAETRSLLRSIDQLDERPSHHPVSLLTLARPPRLVGRDAEKRRLQEAWSLRRPVLLIGEAGIGKTRLLDDVLGVLPGTGHVKARPSDAGVPLAVMTRLLQAVLASWPACVAETERPHLARLLPQLGAVPRAEGPGQRQALLNAFERCLISAADHGMDGLVLDDLHFADEASLLILQSLLDSDGGSRLRWAFAQRPALPDSASGRLLAAFAQATQMQTIELPPLTEAHLESLLRSLQVTSGDVASAAGRLFQHSGGNPLFVLETLREAARSGNAAGAMPSPRSVGAVIEHRLQLLSPLATDLARVAAVAGVDFTVELAATVLRRPAIGLAGAWRELEAADVLRGTAFAHDLVHDAAQRLTPHVIAEQVHCQVGALLEEQQVEPARIAAHWQAGRRPLEEGRAWLRAAQRAFAAGLQQQQAELLQAAAAALYQAHADDEAHVITLQAVMPLLRTKGTAAAHALLEQLQSRELPHVLAARTLAARAEVMVWESRGDEAQELAGQALRMNVPDVESNLQAVIMLVQAWAMTGRQIEGLRLIEEWASRAAKVEDFHLRSTFIGAHFNLLQAADRMRDAAVVAEQHVALVQTGLDTGEHVASLINLTVVAIKRGDWTRALQATREADALTFGAIELAVFRAWNSVHMALLDMALGHHVQAWDALAYARSVLQAPGTNAALLGVLNDLTVKLLLRLGQTAKAGRYLAPMDAGVAARRRAARLIQEAAVAAALRRDPRAPLREARALLEGVGAKYLWLAVSIELATFDSPDHDRLRRLEAFDADAQAHDFMALAALAASLQAETLAQLETTPSVALLHDVASRAERLVRAHPSTQLYFPQGLHRCAMAYRAAGQGEDALRCLDDAMRWIETARTNTPAAFRDGFFSRNPANLAVRAAAVRFAAELPARLMPALRIG